MYRSHVGLNFKNRSADLFCFQVINEQGMAVAVVDFDEQELSRILTTEQLRHRIPAILRLARYYLAKCRTT